MAALSFLQVEKTCSLFFFRAFLLGLIFFTPLIHANLVNAQLGSLSFPSTQDKLLSPDSISTPQNLNQGDLTPNEISKGKALLKQGDATASAAFEAELESRKRGRDIENMEVPPDSDSAEEDLGTDHIRLDVSSPFERQLETNISEDLSLTVEPFAYDLFLQAPRTFAPLEVVPVMSDYLLGPGDEMRVTVWGKINADHTMRVDRDGKVVLPQIGALHLAGLTFLEAKSFVKKAFSRYYKASEVKLNISMGQLRAIQVFVVGKAKNPGVYTLSSFSTLINALFASGGPSKVGTTRDIQVKRQGKVIAHFDLYDLLLKGDKGGDIRLMSGDVIFIPTVGSRVSIVGNVKSPAIYESRLGFHLKGLVGMAGGINATGDHQRVQVERFSDLGTRIILDIDLHDLSGQKDLPLLDGDVVKVFSIYDEVKNSVTLKGNVTRPGRYSWRKGMRLRDLFQGEGHFLPETFLDYALLERLVMPDRHKEYLSVSLGALLFEGAESENILLFPDDKLVVFNRWDLLEKESVRIKGGVNRSGDYEYHDNMTLSTLFQLAGGVLRPEHPESYLQEGMILRRMPPDFHEEKIAYSLRKVLFEKNSAADLPLYPNDEVHLFDHWDLAQERRVRIGGAIENPGAFTWAKNMRISDLLRLSNGTKYYAYLAEAELTRISPTPEGPDVERIVVDIQKALAGDLTHDLLLKTDDYLSILAVPEWELYRTVDIAGEVRFPGTYTSKKGERLSSLIDRAGGFTENAYLKGAVFTRISVQLLQQQRLDDAIDRLEQQLLSRSASTIESALSPEAAQQQQASLVQRNALLVKMRTAKAKGRLSLSLQKMSGFVGSSSDLTLEEGDVLLIPERPQQVQVMGSVFNQTAFIFEETTTTAEYLEKAGGLTSDANEDALYVLKVDGTAYSHAQTSGFWFWKTTLESSTLDPGDTLVVPENLDKTVWLREVKDVTQILYQIAVTTGVLLVAF